MARTFLLIALCVLPALVTAIRPASDPYYVEGRVYCDRCQAGFETSKIDYIPGAKVKIECKDRKSMELVYSKDGTTDSEGKYRISVNEDHADQVCDCKLVHSPLPDCKAITPGRESARVILTSTNGMVSRERYANAMGYMADKPDAGCAEVLKQYEEEESDD